MQRRIRSALYDLGDTLWFVPAIMTTVAVVIAFLMLALDRSVLIDREIHAWWLFEGGAEGARGVLGTIAGTMMTVATTAFSITIVALQLGSSQFSPRILRGFTGDRGNQLVLGMFIATFAYSLVVLRAIKSESSDLEAFVPPGAVTLAIILAFAAIGSLIFFFHHATRTIQASVVIERTSEDLYGLIARRLAQDEGREDEGVTDVVPRDDLATIALERAGYIHHIDVPALARAGAGAGVVITMGTQVGRHVLSNTPVVTLPKESYFRLTHDERRQLEEGVRGAISTSMERTLEHDLLLGFRQLSDIAIKALSPGINDPTTAITAIDSMGEALFRVRNLQREVRYRATEDGTGGVREVTIGLEQVLDECLPQIRHYGAGDMLVICHLLRVLGDIATDAIAPSRALLADRAMLVEEEALAEIGLEADRERVREAAAWAHLLAGAAKPATTSSTDDD